MLLHGTWDSQIVMIRLGFHNFVVGSRLNNYQPDRISSDPNELRCVATKTIATASFAPGLLNYDYRSTIDIV